MNKVVVGIDVSKKKFDVALYREGKYKHKVLPNTEAGFEAFLVWLKTQGVESFHACLESTGVYGEALSYYLHDKGHYVSVVNPAKIKAFGNSELSRNKSDKLDAKLIARFCAAMNPPQWQPAPQETRVLRHLVKRLEELQKLYLIEGNHLEAATSEEVKASIQKISSTLEEEIKRVKSKINDHLDQNPKLKDQKALLETIPGIGPATIAQLLSCMCTPERFSNPKELVAYVGLNPKNRQSGSSVKGGSVLSKTGDSTLRKALYMPAIVAARHNPVLKVFYERLVAAHKPKKSAICAVMRKLVVLIYSILKSGIPFDPNFVPVEM